MIHIAGLSRTYRSFWSGARSVRALEGVSLDVAPGTALGLIGLNGAGKTTLIRLLLGYIAPTAGSIAVGGLAPRRYVERNGIAYVPERVAIPGRWTVEGALQAYAMMGNLGDDASERVAAALLRLGLDELRDRRVARLAKGNLQRLAIAQALLCERELLILDEPTDGLDPIWIAGLRSIIAEWRAAEPRRTVIIASHNLPQLERIVDRIVVLHEGRILSDFLIDREQPGEPLEDTFLRLLRAGAEAA
jgi:ABC-2 type transport system ATP-binding protein